MRRVRRHVLRSAGYFFLSVLFAMVLGCSGGGGGGGSSTGTDGAGVDSSGVSADGTVPLYSVYERSVTNTKSYPNKFTDVTLNVEYTAPSGRRVAFWGFYDGDGKGGQDGSVWKMRFMPDEVGTWTYEYAWSDGTAGESGTFVASEKGAGRGMLRAYGENKHWFAYNGTDPVFLRSYYIGTGGFAGVPIDWAAKNVYGKLIARGYNHVQLVMLPLGWTDSKPADAPGDHIGKPLWHDTPRVQNLDIWKRMEQHVAWLNARNMHIHFFMGIDPKSGGATDASFALQRFSDMSGTDQEFYIRYLAARLAPYANITGWNYTWETDGGGSESRMAELLAQHDPWGHARTYHDEEPADNRYDDSNYTFAGIENHGYFGNANGAPALDSASHYQSTRDAFRDKPVYMVEGNGLWRACWAQGAAETTITRSAWAVTLAGGSFTWQDWPVCGYTTAASEMFTWPSGNPMVDRLDVLYNVMTQDVAFHRLTPANELLSSCWNSFDRWGSVPTAPCYAAADPGAQYVVYKEDGGSFGLSVAAGSYAATWIDTRTGARQPANGGTVQGGTTVTFAAPSTATDWVLVLSAG